MAGLPALFGLSPSEFEAEAEYFLLRDRGPIAPCNLVLRAIIYLLFFPLVYTYWRMTSPLPWFSSNGQKERDKWQKLRHVHYTHRSGAIKRRKSLSIGKSAPSWFLLRKRRRSYDQSQSIFFRLPSEIRNMIYEYAIVQETAISIAHADSGVKLYRFPCDEDPKAEIRGYIEYLESALGEGDPYESKDYSCTGSLLSPLRTCRLMYTETIGMLYRKNRFLFKREKDFVHFCEATPHDRLLSISSLDLFLHTTTRGEWEHAFDILASMTGLTRLLVFTVNTGDACLSFPESATSTEDPQQDRVPYRITIAYYKSGLGVAYSDSSKMVKSEDRMVSLDEFLAML